MKSEYTMFPSPCGDMVLKYVRSLAKTYGLTVSVPLRGYGFEILTLGCLVLTA